MKENISSSPKYISSSSWAWSYTTFPSFLCSWVQPCEWQRCHLYASSVQLLSCVWLFATPWTAARQASLSITNSGSPPKPMSVESVMPSNHLILFSLWSKYPQPQDRGNFASVFGQEDPCYIGQLNPASPSGAGKPTNTSLLMYRKSLLVTQNWNIYKVNGSYN